MSSKSVNRVTLVGNVGKEPDVRNSGSTIIATFSLATSERSKDDLGNWIDKTEWHNIVAFGRNAEIVRDYVRKGARTYVEGKLQTRSWDDRDSKKKLYKTEVVVTNLILFERNKEGGEATNTYPPKSTLATKPPQDDSDDIPF